MKTLIAVLFVCILFIFHYSPSTAQSWKELDSLGGKLYAEGKYKEAIGYFEKALVQLEKESGKDNRDYAVILNSLGLLCSTQGIYDKAELYHKEGIEIFAKVAAKDNIEYASMVANLGILYYRQGIYNKAEPAYLEAKEIFGKVVGKNHPNYSTVVGLLGNLYLKQGLCKKALPFFIESKEILEKVNIETSDYALALSGLGMLYIEMADYPKAEQLLLEARSIIVKQLGENHIYNVYVLNNLGTIYRQLANYAKAEPVYMESLRIRKNTLGEKHSDYAIALNNLAQLYDKQKKYDKAEPMYLEAIQILKNHPNYAAIVNNLATMYKEQKAYSKAEPMYLEALEVCRKTLGESNSFYATYLHNLGSLYFSKANYAKADSCYSQAFEYRGKILSELHPDYIGSLRDLAVLYRTQNQYTKASPFFIKSIQNKLQELKTNFLILSENEKKLYLDQNQMFFMAFYGGLIGDIIQKQPDYQDLPNLLQKLINLQLQTKGILLSETSKMRKRILASGDTSLINEFERWQAVKSSISKTYNLPIAQREKQGIDIGKLENQANELERRLSARSEDFKTAFNPPIYTSQDVQKKLKPEEVAIEMIRTEYKNAQTDKADTAYLALIVSNQSIRPLLIKNGKDLETTYLQTYQKLMKVSKNPKVFEDTLLYRAFWKPIAEQLGSEVKTVYFSPDGVYHQINLNTLQDPVSKRFVVEENYQIQLLTSLQDLFAEKKINENKTALLIGRPQYSMSKEEYQATAAKVRSGEELISEAQKVNKAVSEVKWGDLPQTETEVNGVSKLLKNKKWEVRVFTGKEALEEQIRKVKNPTILHLATHGYFTPTDDKNQINGMLNSGLILAGVNTLDKDSKSEDGVLTAYEAADLNLDQTDLVVLSACETGLGEVASGEGVYGLQRGFKVAGAKSLIMSLWKVEDQVAQAFMQIFYKEWLTKGKSKREAFVEAQRQIKKEKEYPYYWGAFVMVGE